MIIEYQYNNEQERSDLIKNNSDKVLVSERITDAGSFLTFSTNPDIEQGTAFFMNINDKPLEDIFEELGKRQDATDAAVLQLLMEGMM